MPLRTTLAALAIVVVGVSAPLAHADEASRRSIIAEIFHVMQYEKVIEQMADVVAAQAVGEVKTTHPNLDSGTESVIRAVVRESFQELTPEMMKFTDELMSKYFTEGELREMLAYYKTTAGRKSIQVMPQVMQETVIWVQQAVSKLTPRIMEKLKARLEDEGISATG